MKKIITALLAVLLVFNVSVIFGNAGAENSLLEYVDVYRGVDGQYYLMSDSNFFLDIGTAIKLYKNLENNEKELLKDFYSSEIYSLRTGNAVEIPVLSSNATYCLAVIPPQKATQSDAGQVVYYHDFTCSELKADRPQFGRREVYMNERQIIDMINYVIFPLDYNAEQLTYKTTSITEHMEIEYTPLFDKNVELNGSQVTAVDDGTVRIKMYDANGDFLDMCTVKVGESAPDTFGDLIGDTEENIREGLGDAFLMLGSDILYVFSWMIFPIVLPITVIFGLII